MFTAQFWKDAFERATKSAAQAALLNVGADQIDVLNTDWGNLGSFVLAGFVLSLLTSIVSTPFGNKGSASLVPDVAKDADDGNPPA